MTPPPTALNIALPDIEDVVDCIKSFPKGTAAGPDGLRAQHLKDILRQVTYDHPADPRNLLCRFLQLLLDGKAPESISGYLAGANLIPLTKANNGIRPIAVGCTWRRLAAKLAIKMLSDQAPEMLLPHQVGVGVPLGAEALTKATKKIANQNKNVEDFVIFTVDFSNAFNSVSRNAFLRETRIHFPQIYNWVRWCYSQPSNLIIAPGTTISSQEGAQQGDPLGPLLFSLALHPIAVRISKEIPNLKLNSWYLDDGTIAGSTRDVLKASKLIQEAGMQIGLKMNLAKCSLYWPSYMNKKDKYNNDIFDSSIIREEAGFRLLGIPIGSDEFCKSYFLKQIDNVTQMLSKLTLLEDPQVALAILRNCSSLCKVNYLLRSLPSTITREGSEKFDKEVIRTLEEFSGLTLTDLAVSQLRLPCKKAGFSIYSAVEIADPAFHGSKLDCKDLVSRLLQHCSPKSPTNNNDINNNNQTAGTKGNVRRNQNRLTQTIHETSWNNISKKADTTDMARLTSLQGKHMSMVLDAPLAPVRGFALTPDEFTTWMGYTLGLSLFPSSPPVDGEEHINGSCPICHRNIGPMTTFHAVTCKHGPHNHRRHNKIRDYLYHICRSANLEPRKEVTISNRNSGKQVIPGDVFLPSTTISAMATAIDITVTHPQQTKTVNKAATTLDHANDMAKEKKTKKYHHLEQEGVNLIVLSIEFFGRIGKDGDDFLTRLAGRLGTQSSKPRSAILKVIRRRITFILVKANARAILDRKECQQI